MRVHAILAALTISAMPLMAQAHGLTTAADAAANSLSASGSYSQGGNSYSQGGNSDAGVTYAPQSTYTDNSSQNFHNAYAPDAAVVTANACALGTSASAGGGGFFSLGLSLANTDKRCGHEADAAAWHALGNNVMATAMMCLTPADASAYLATFGVPCPGQPGAPAAPLPTAAPVAAPAPAQIIIIQPKSDTTSDLNDASYAAVRG